MRLLILSVALLTGCADMTPDQNAAMMRFGQALMARQPAQQYQQQGGSTLWRQEFIGQYRQCTYQNGVVLTLPGNQFCPPVNYN